MKRGIRDLVFAISPPWLQFGATTGEVSGIGGKLMYVFGLAMDGLMEKLNEAERAHMPGQGTDTALPLIGADLVTPQGPNEPNASYAIRLSHAIDEWRIAGNATSVMREVLPQVLPATPKIETVSNTSAWDVYAAGADTTQPPVHTLVGGTPNWNWDNNGDDHAVGLTNEWWRWWLVIFSVSPNNWCNAGPVFGAGGATIGDATKSIGFDTPPPIYASIRGVVSQRKAAHSWCRWIIVSFDSSLFDVAQPSGGTSNPDGGWHKWGKANGPSYVASRFTNNARYVDGVI